MEYVLLVVKVSDNLVYALGNMWSLEIEYFSVLPFNSDTCMMSIMNDMHRDLRKLLFNQLPDKGMGQEALMKEIDEYEKLGKIF